MSRFKKKDLLQEHREKLSQVETTPTLPEEEMTAVERLFHKWGVVFAKNRKVIYLSVLGFLLVLFSVVGFFEWQKSQEEKATIELEDILDSFQKTPTPDAVRKEKLKAYLDNHSSGKIYLRASKELSEVLIGLGEYKEAAELLEKTARKIDEFREVKAYYFYLAGLARENAGDYPLAIQNYQTSSTLLANTKGTPSFRAWSLLQEARLLLKENKTSQAKDNLNKILEMESSENPQAIEEVRKLATVLLFQIANP